MIPQWHDVKFKCFILKDFAVVFWSLRAPKYLTTSFKSLWSVAAEPGCSAAITIQFPQNNYSSFISHWSPTVQVCTQKNNFTTFIKNLIIVSLGYCQHLVCRCCPVKQQLWAVNWLAYKECNCSDEILHCEQLQTAVCLFLVGEQLLQAGEVFSLHPLQLYSVSQQLRLAKPTCCNGDAKTDLGHILDFTCRLRYLKVTHVSLFNSSPLHSVKCCFKEQR